MRVLLRLALFCLVAWPSTRASLAGDAPRSPDPSELLRVLDGNASPEEAGRLLSAAGWTPESAAEALRKPAPMPAPPDRGTRKIPLRGGDGRETDLWVYVPAAYDGSKPWPLMVALHGKGSNGREMASICRPVADRYGYLLVAPTAQSFRGMLPVLGHWWRYAADGFVIGALDWAKKNLLVDDDRVLLLGYSMGGFGTWNLGLMFPDRFLALAPFAGGISEAEFTGGSDRRRRSLLPNAALVRLYFAHGDEDRIVPVQFDRESHESLSALEIPHVYREIRGAGHMLPGVLAIAKGDFEKADLVVELFDGLKGKKRPGLGGAFEFTALETPAQARWIRIDEASAFPCRVRARLEGRELRVESENVRRFAVLLDGRSPPPGEPLAVLSGGKEAFRGSAAPAWGPLVRSWRSLRDRERVFVSEIPVRVEEGEGEEGF